MQIYLGLGSNVAPRREHLGQALKELQQWLESRQKVSTQTAA